MSSIWSEDLLGVRVNTCETGYYYYYCSSGISSISCNNNNNDNDNDNDNSFTITSKITNAMPLVQRELLPLDPLTSAVAGRLTISSYVSSV